MFERFKTSPIKENLPGIESENKTEQTRGGAVVDAAVMATAKETAIAKTVRRSRDESAAINRDISTRWKAVAFGTALAFGLNFFAPKAHAEERSTDSNHGKDTAGQVEHSMEEIVQHAKENIASRDMALMRTAVQLINNLSREPEYTKTYPATGNAFYPTPYDAKDYVSGTSNASLEKQKTMKQLDTDRLFEKAKLIASEIVEKELGAEALTDEEIQKSVGDMAKDYSERNIKNLERKYFESYTKTLADVRGFEESGQPSAGAPSSNEGPSPEGVRLLNDDYQSADLIQAMVVFHSAMMSAVIDIGNSYMEKIKKNPTALEMAKAVAGSENHLNAVGKNYLQNLTLEQALLVTWDKSIEDSSEELANNSQVKLEDVNSIMPGTIASVKAQDKLAEIANMQNVIPDMNRYHEWQETVKSRMSPGHDKTFFDEIQPGKYADLFQQLNMAFVSGDVRILGEKLDEAKKAKLIQKISTNDYQSKRTPAGDQILMDDRTDVTAKAPDKNIVIGYGQDKKDDDKYNGGSQFGF